MPREKRRCAPAVWFGRRARCACIACTRTRRDPERAAADESGMTGRRGRVLDQASQLQATSIFFASPPDCKYKYSDSDRLGPSPNFRLCVVDDLEDVAVDRFAEKETLERRRPKRIEQVGAVIFQPLLERGEVRRRMEERDETAEFSLELRRRERLDVQHVQTLTGAEIKPHDLDRRVRRNWKPPISQRVFKKLGSGLDLLGCERQVRERHVSNRWSG